MQIIREARELGSDVALKRNYPIERATRTLLIEFGRIVRRNSNITFLFTMILNFLDFRIS